MGVFYPKEGEKNPNGIQISTIAEEIEKLKDANTSTSVNNGESLIRRKYNQFEEKILETLETGGISPRPGASSGFYLGPLIGMCAIITFYKESPYTEIPLLGAITGTGLILSSICLIIQLLIIKSANKNFHMLYFIPVAATSALYFYAADKELIVSVSWGISVGSLSTWGVLQIMSEFPKRFTLGEATIITHGVLLFLLSNGATSPMREVIPPGYSHALAATVWQAGITFLGLLCFIYAFISWIRTTFFFLFMAVVTLLIHFSPWIYMISIEGDITYHEVYMMAISGRISLIIFWAILFLVGTVIITYEVLSESHGPNVARRTFTVIAASIIISGLIYDQRLIHLVSGIVMTIFIVFELIKYLFTSSPLDELKIGASDEKNVPIPFSPLYSYLGVASPLWMHVICRGTLPRLSGVLTILVGDTAARIVGNKWGKNKWPGSDKTLEGTIACILSQLICVYGVVDMGYFYLDHWKFLLHVLLVVGISLVEGLSDQIDNLVLPFLFYFGSSCIY